jgi:hypothetical protein
VPASGIGYVTRFAVRKTFLDRYEVQQVGGASILEYWILAEDLETFNLTTIPHVPRTVEYCPIYK